MNTGRRDTSLAALVGPPELAAALQDLVRSIGATVDGVVAAPVKGSRVYRVRVNADRASRSFIVKRFSSAHVAQRNQQVLQRWLPASGLGDAAPCLLGVAAERDGRRVWHIYEDFGDCALAADAAANDRARIFAVDRDRIGPAVALIARIHAGFAGHPLLAECRLAGGDFGSRFLASSVDDGVRALEALLARADDHTGVWSRLGARLHDLRRQQAERSDALARFGGPETLVHGDLWPINVLVPAGGRAALIDWDHAGVGPVSYDLSTFLTHFPRDERRPILDLYLRCMADRGIRFPRETDWNLLFDTAEQSRLAISVAFEALSALYHPSDWAFEDLARVEQWFEQLEPLLPVDSSMTAPEFGAEPRLRKVRL